MWFADFEGVCPTWSAIENAKKFCFFNHPSKGLGLPSQMWWAYKRSTAFHVGD